MAERDGAGDMSGAGPAIRSGQLSVAPAGRWRPWWLADPSRAAGFARSSARLAIGIVGVQVIAALLTPVRPADPVDDSVAGALGDAVRAGAGFYAAAGDLARSGAVRADALAVPLPTLATASAAIPALAGWALLPLLAVLTIAAWRTRLREDGGLTRAGLGIATLLLGIGLLGVLRWSPAIFSPASGALSPSPTPLPEAWAAPLLLLALARRGPGRIVEPAALGLAAGVLAPAALPALGVLAAMAWRKRDRREAAGWGVALAAGLALLALHARALALLPDAGDAAVPTIGFDLAAGLGGLVHASGLGLLPVLPARLLGLAAAIGWAGWSVRAADRATGRPAALLVVYALLAAAAGERAALIVAPLLPLGLVALPDTARDLIRAARDRRRFTVTRIVR